MHALVEAGADIIELGVPFSDPMADGPAIQRSSERALKHHTTLKAVLGAVAQFRSSERAHAGGADGLCQSDRSDGRANASRKLPPRAGVDGVLVVDYPPEEGSELHEQLRSRGIDSIFLLSPTSEDARMEKVGARGERLHLLRIAQGRDRREQPRSGRGRPQDPADPLPHQAAGRRGLRHSRCATRRSAVARVSDAVVIGSRLVQEIEQSNPEQVVGNVRSLVGWHPPGDGRVMPARLQAGPGLASNRGCGKAAAADPEAT